MCLRNMMFKLQTKKKNNSNFPLTPFDSVHYEGGIIVGEALKAILKSYS